MVPVPNQAVSTAEIDDAIKSIDSNKAPGIDGFNSFFFKKNLGHCEN